MERRNPRGLAVHLAGFTASPLVDAKPQRSPAPVDGRRTISAYVTYSSRSVCFFAICPSHASFGESRRGARELTRACAFRYDESRARAQFSSRVPGLAESWCPPEVPGHAARSHLRTPVARLGFPAMYTCRECET